MQDRYLYKAKRVDNGEWVQGSLIVNNRDDEVYIRAYEPKENTIGLEWNVYTVDPSTICQCTGLKDKYGALIWENDIVEAWSEGVRARGTVKRRVDGLWLMYPAWQKGISWGLCPNDTGKTTVVRLGNKIDNPELLEVLDE